MRGILLAGGTGSRLFPSTLSTSKQLLTIYDKPMIYYSLSVLMLGGIRNIDIICTPTDYDRYKYLLGDGSNFGITIDYVIQDKPEGIAQAFNLIKEEHKNQDVCLVLGDNVFVGQGFGATLNNALQKNNGATIFLSHVANPSEFGVATVDADGQVTQILEKPKYPQSNLAVTGLYIYKSDVYQKSKTLSPSARNEYEITDINNIYLNERRLSAQVLGRGFAWLDTGTPNGLLEASNFVAALQNRQNLIIGCLEEIALKNNWITEEHLSSYLETCPRNHYYQYLRGLLNVTS